jgi:Ca-activated chloride channel family protein
MSTCDAIRERLAESGAEAAENAVEIRHHLEGCADCTRFLDELSQVEAGIANLPTHDAPDALVAETLSAVRAAAGAEKTPPRPFTVQRYVGLGLAASVVIAAGLGLTLSREWLNSQRQMVAEAPAPQSTAVTDRDEAKDRLARSAQSPESLSLTLRDNLPAETEGETVARTESFEMAELGQKKGEVEAARREGEEDLFRHAGEPQSVEGLSSELDVIAQLDAQGRHRETGRLSTQEALKESSEIDRLLSAPEEQPVSKMAGDKAKSAKTKQDVGSDDLSGNESASVGFGYYADAPAPSQEPTTGPEPSQPGLSGTGEAVGGLRADQSSAVESADEEATRGEAVLADNKNREYRRQALVAPADPQVAQSLAADFLGGYQWTDGLTYQEPTGYWANSYIPGDPAMRLLQARLKAWDRGSLGQEVQLEERVRPVQQPFDAPQYAALAVYLDADAPAIDGPTRLRLQIGIKGAERQGGHRPAMNIGLLVDLRDGMGGADGEAARRIRALIAALERSRQPEDRFSLTVAGPGGGLLVPPGEFRHGPLRVAMEVLGSSLVLLATGSSLAGDLSELERMAHLNAVAGVPLSVVSLAAQEDLAHIDRLVAAGQGNRRILDRAQAADGVVDRELHASSRAVARALRLRIRLAPGVKLVNVLGSRRLGEELAQRVREAEVAIDRRLARNLGIQADRGEDEEGIQIVIPNFYAGDSHTILLDVVAENPGPLADVTLRYKDVVYLRNGVARANLTLEDGPRAAGPLELNVLKNLVAWEFAQQARLVGRYLADGDPQQAAAALASLRDLIHGLRLEVAGWQTDPGLLADEAMLEEYLGVLASPAAGDTVQRRFLADSLRYAAFRKLQTAAR